MIIFCGIQATGKSTFYKEHFFNTHLRISLDLLNTRNKEEKIIKTCLTLHQKIVIDNTNPTQNDRKRYIDWAKSAKYKVIGYYFQSKIQDSIARNNQRIGKEKITEKGIVGTFNRLELPDLSEGFDELYFVSLLPEKGFNIQKWEKEDKPMS